MKRNILNSIFFSMIIFFGACTSDMRMPEVTKTSLPLITLDPTSDVLIQGGILNGKFNVDMYYKDYPSDSRIVIAMNGNYSNLKVLTSSVKTFPSAQTVNDAKLVSLFGLTTINAGDYFEVGLDVQNQDGTWYPAFNALGVSYGTGPVNLPGSSPIITFKAVCALDINDFVATANLTDAADAFYGGTYATPIQKFDATTLLVKNFAGFSGDLKLIVNLKTHAVTVPKQVFGADCSVWGASYAKYTNPAAEGKGTLDACNRKIKVTLTYTVDQGGFGTYPVTITY